MQEKPEISVVMAAFNAEQYVASAVDSILSQTFDDFELIVINDGSKDGTLKVLQSIADDRVRIISNPANMGIPKSSNIGISQARGRYIARQDADDISLPQRLEKQYDYLQKHPEIAVLGTARKTMFDNGIVKSHDSPLQSPTFEDMLAKNCFVHGSIMVRKNALEKVGGYNEIFRYTSDYDLCIRLTKNFPGANLREPLYVLRRHANRVTLRKMVPAILYRLLAKNLALGVVEDSVLQQIQNKGVEFYYDCLSKEDKIFYHGRVGKKQMNYHYDQQALEQYQKLLKLQGFTFKVVGNFLVLKLRLVFKNQTIFPK